MVKVNPSALTGGAAVRVFVREGLEALLPLADLVDADKERARLGKMQVYYIGLCVYVYMCVCVYTCIYTYI